MRTAGNPSAAASSLHGAVRELDPDLPLFDLRTVAEHLQLSVFIPRIAGSVLGVFGGLARVDPVVLAFALALSMLSRLRARAGAPPAADTSP